MQCLSDKENMYDDEAIFFENHEDVILSEASYMLG